jgi:hypothetical protein
LENFVIPEFGFMFNNQHLDIFCEMRASGRQWAGLLRAQ